MTSSPHSHFQTIERKIEHEMHSARSKTQTERERDRERESEWIKLPKHPHYAICPPSVCVSAACERERMRRHPDECHPKRLKQAAAAAAARSARRRPKADGAHRGSAQRECTETAAETERDRERQRETEHRESTRENNRAAAVV